MKILADNYIGSRLGPVGRHFHVILFKDDGAFVVPDGSGAQLPRNVIVGRFPRFQLLSEELREAYSLALGNREGLFANFVFQVYDFTAAESDAGVCHLFLLCELLKSNLPSVPLAGDLNTIVTNRTRFLRLSVIMPQYVVERQGLYLYTVQHVAATWVANLAIRPIVTLC
jgi:hypothetical protein